MKKISKKVTLRWSKKENDWICEWPEWENRSAKAIAGGFFDMIQKFEEFMSKDFEGRPTGFVTFREYLLSGGFDPDTFKITVEAKKS